MNGHWETCPDCRGNAAEDYCPTCRGRGVVWVDDEEPAEPLIREPDSLGG